MAMAQNQWYHVGICAPPILEPSLVVGLGSSLGANRGFDPWPNSALCKVQSHCSMCNASDSAGCDLCASLKVIFVRIPKRLPFIYWAVCTTDRVVGTGVFTRQALLAAFTKLSPHQQDAHFGS